MELADIVALTGNVATALRGLEERLARDETLDAALADARGLSAAITAVRAIEQVRLRLPPAERHESEARILHSLATAVRGFANLIEVLHELALAMTRDEALAAYWSARNHAEEHAAYQRLIRLGEVDGEVCPECPRR